MMTVSGRAWLSALALVAVGGPALAAGDGPDSVSVRQLSKLPDENVFSSLVTNFESQPRALLNGQLYFFTGPRVESYEHRPLTLWATDGTAQGTRSVQDLVPASAVMDPMTLAAVPGRLFFSAWSYSASGRELWTSDGTAQGTHVVRDIQPGVASGVRSPNLPVAFGDSVLFVAEGSEGDSELWKSDGTEAGTVRIKDVLPGPQGSFPSILGRCGDAMLFSAAGPEGRELWRTDGTEAGTWRVRDIHPGVGSSNPSAITAMGSTCFFTVDDVQHGRALWKTDGTEKGTALVSDLVAGRFEPALSQFTALGDTLLFLAQDGQQVDLWRTDGTEAGTLPVKALPRDITGTVTLVRAGARVYYLTQGTGSGRQLWMTDGTAEQTTVVPLEDAGQQRVPSFLAAWGDELVFYRAPNEWGAELWRTDGTAQGTYRLARVPSSRTYSPSTVVSFGDSLLVPDDSNFQGLSLWRLDRDATAPAFRDCPAHLDVPATHAQGTEMHLPVPTLTGGQAPLTVRTSHPEGTPLSMPMGFGVYYEAEDAQGRVAACAMDVTVADLTPPTIQGCPSELIVNTRSSQGATVYYPPFTVTEESGGDVITSVIPENGSTLPVGTTLVTMTARDRVGNTSTCAFPVTVRDGQPPAAACKVSEVRVEAEGPDGARAWWPEADASDNVSARTTTSRTHSPGDLFPLGITRVQLTRTDEAGNSRACEIQVKVRDSRPPALTCPEDVTLKTAVMSGTRADYPLATAEDTVSPAEILYTPELGTPLAPGMHSVQVTALDRAGNAALCNFHVAVEYDPTSDMSRSLGCSVGSGPASGAGWAALLLLGWTLSRRKKGTEHDA
ncbi:HYR domain-containing protein [Corallococcus praedator]|uniref:HYR domain-containing protein n=1 Tax=Corallococcus praedator TaxID=2316724 RepID=A0ABX9QNQ2_9BACT|nr:MULTISPECIES: HYR domain-containing protein [Corallococcus]RKH32900.1 HYR domain-containing protein [Corallococcus sp. CA031C]RKI13693.1 HYR domain-containing protein [Corallococcus praedator]